MNNVGNIKQGGFSTSKREQKYILIIKKEVTILYKELMKLFFLNETSSSSPSNYIHCSLYLINIPYRRRKCLSYAERNKQYTPNKLRETFQ
jgi:hypothetical protein